MCLCLLSMIANSMAGTVTSCTMSSTRGCTDRLAKHFWRCRCRFLSLSLPMFSLLCRLISNGFNDTFNKLPVHWCSAVCDCAAFEPKANAKIEFEAYTRRCRFAFFARFPFSIRWAVCSLSTCSRCPVNWRPTANNRFGFLSLHSKWLQMVQHLSRFACNL